MNDQADNQAAYIPPQDPYFQIKVDQYNENYQGGPPQTEEPKTYQGFGSNPREADRLDSKCFTFYKILLIVVPSLLVLNSLLTIQLLHLLVYCYLLYFCILQFQAVHGKNLCKAWEASTGLKFYILVFTTIQIVALIGNLSNWAGYLIEWVVHLMIFFITILAGSLETENILKKEATIQA